MVPSLYGSVEKPLRFIHPNSLHKATLVAYRRMGGNHQFYAAVMCEGWGVCWYVVSVRCPLVHGSHSSVYSEYSTYSIMWVKNFALTENTYLEVISLKHTNKNSILGHYQAKHSVGLSHEIWTVNYNESILFLLWNCWISRVRACSSGRTLAKIHNRPSWWFIWAEAGLQSCVIISLSTNLTVIGRQVQLLQQLADTNPGPRIPIWTSSCQIVPLIRGLRYLLKADEEPLLSRSGKTSLHGFN